MTAAFEDELGFVESVINTFDVGADRTRVAAITFSDNAETVFDFHAGAGPGSGLPEDACSGAHNLADLQSPHSWSTAQAPATGSTATDCGGNAASKIYYAYLPPGATLTIHQTENDFNSRHQTKWGGVCPGANLVACTDDPDETEHTWTNQQTTVQPVYFMIDGSGNQFQGGAYSPASGTFYIDWHITAYGTGTGLWAPDPVLANGAITRANVLRMLREIPAPRGNTNTPGALLLGKELFSEARGARALSDGIPRVAVLITDGASNRPCRCIGPGATLCHTASTYDCTDETIGKAAMEVRTVR